MTKKEPESERKSCTCSRRSITAGKKELQKIDGCRRAARRGRCRMSDEKEKAASERMTNENN
jgi:hypothetical protein